MLILTWNVAGLSSTVHRIYKNYSCDANNVNTTTTNTTNANTSTTSDETTVDDDNDNSSSNNKCDTPVEEGDDNAVINLNTQEQDTTYRNHRNAPSNPYQRNLSTPSSNNDLKKSTTKTSDNNHTTKKNVLLYYFQKHNADIICLQEHKISISQLKNRMEPYHCSTLYNHQSGSNTNTTANATNKVNSTCNDSTVTVDDNANTDSNNPDDVYYESFWSCCTDPKQKGFNGVVTYVKCYRTNNSDNKDNSSMISSVISANGTSCFTDEYSEFNQHGRCVITEHGPPINDNKNNVSYNSNRGNSTSSSTTSSPGFVLFNVYVPCSSSSIDSMKKKMKFLNGLHISMQQQRILKQKPIILVGDLNISYNKYDIHYLNRIVYINDLIHTVQQEQQQNQNQTNIIPQWKLDIVTYWSTIVDILQTKQAVSTTTTNSMTGETFQKYRLCVTIPIALNNNNNNNNNDNNNNNTNTKNSTTRQIYLGNHEMDPSYCYYDYTFTEQSYYDDERQQSIKVQEENTISVHVLVELMNKLICNNNPNIIHPPNVWDNTTIHEIADTVGTINHLSPPRQWLQKLFDEDHMVDTFRYYYKDALGRYTCWNQNKNCRYNNNNGTRIDYILIDESLVPFLLKGDVSTLRCGYINDNDITNINSNTDTFACSEVGAIQAVTANGRYVPASYDKNGIVEANKDVLDTQFGIPHTGHLYTPPTYSDHIGVSALFHDTIVSYTNLNMYRNHNTMMWNDSITRKSQPHKIQPKIGTFFSMNNHHGNNNNKHENEKQGTTAIATLKSIKSSNTTSITSKSSRNSKMTVVSTVTSNKQYQTSTAKRKDSNATKHTKQNKNLKPTLSPSSSLSIPIVPPRNSVWYHFTTTSKATTVTTATTNASITNEDEMNEVE